MKKLLKLAAQREQLTKEYLKYNNTTYIFGVYHKENADKAEELKLELENLVEKMVECASTYKNPPVISKTGEILYIPA